MSKSQSQKNIILVGAGIMSATLATILKEVEPDINITIYEKLAKPGEESSNEWNNAGTGHSALCELNYTTENRDGSIDISKAITINEQFQISKQFWSYLINEDKLSKPSDFINPLPHISWVRGEANVEFLKKRFKALIENPLFQGMEYADDPEKLEEWMPLIMKNRVKGEAMAATKIDSGTDVNFGALTRKLLENLQEQGVQVKYNHTVKDFERMEDGTWEVKLRNYDHDTLEYQVADFLFIGAGGGALPLLQKTRIPESKHIGGFPVSGLFLVCNNPDVVEKHHAKVYGKAAVGAPPMSVPHLDSRYIDGKKTLLFGPFAGFSPKFLKTGSNLDLINSVKLNNVLTMVTAGAKNIPLTKYLIGQLMLSKEQRMDELRNFIPDAKTEEWDTITAGQRVQVIEDNEKGRGTLQFGTELITDSDGTVAALLGASPGASTAVHVVLNVFEKCFGDYLDGWESKLREMIPSYKQSLTENPELIDEVLNTTTETLGLVRTAPKQATK